MSFCLIENLYLKEMDLRLIWLLFILSCGLTQEPMAVLPQGRIVGIKVYTKGTGVPVEIYYGVPYALPPTGRYRFAAPERHPGWKRTFFAHRMPPKCPQISDDENNYFSEDCLYLNIWTPRSAEGNSLPVVVILYNESWLRGGSSLPCQELAAEGVVVVTVMYRLHMLAFFTLQSKSARGNLALLDQYLALLWVHENIGAFGGDPEKITLLGHSAGADSVLYHMVSPRSISLFQRAIVMSPREIWNILDEINSTYTERLSREMVQKLNCIQPSDEEILRCLRALPLSNIQTLFMNSNWSGLQPVTDNFLPESEKFLPNSLSMEFSNVKRSVAPINLLFGTTNLESVLHYGDYFEELAKRGTSYINEHANSLVIPELLQILSLYKSDALPVLQQAIRWEFWGTKPQKEMSAKEAIESLARTESSARWGAGSALLAAKLARRIAHLYVYSYSHPGVDLRGRNLNFSGAVHGSDLVSLLGDVMMLQVARRPASSDERRFSSIFRGYIVNFIKFGSPGLDNEWLPYRPGDGHIYDIHEFNVHHEDNRHSASKEVAFWLQYLPHISNLLSTCVHTEQLTYDSSDGRLRGGMYALSGVALVLLVLLCICVILLRRHHSGRLSITDL